MRGRQRGYFAHALVPLGAARRLRDQLSAHLDAAQSALGNRLAGAGRLMMSCDPPVRRDDPAGLRWARDPEDGRLHAPASVDVRAAQSRGYAECLCTHKLPADVMFEPGPSGLLCVPCVIGAVPDLRALGLLGDT